jgi:hypothetical protein
MKGDELSSPFFVVSFFPCHSERSEESIDKHLRHI